MTLQCPVLLAILWKPGFHSCQLTLSPSKLEIMTNSSQGIPSGEPLGMSMCCGQPHPQKLNSSRAVPPPGRFSCRLRNVLSNGIVSVESVDFRSMMFDLGFTAAHQCGTSLYNNVTSVRDSHPSLTCVFNYMASKCNYCFVRCHCFEISQTQCLKHGSISVIRCKVRKFPTDPVSLERATSITGWIPSQNWWQKKTQLLKNFWKILTQKNNVWNNICFL